MRPDERKGQGRKAGNQESYDDGEMNNRLLAMLLSRELSSNSCARVSLHAEPIHTALENGTGRRVRANLLVAEIDTHEAAAPELLGGGLVCLHDGGGLRALPDEDLRTGRVVALDEGCQLTSQREIAVPDVILTAHKPSVETCRPAYAACVMGATRRRSFLYCTASNSEQFKHRGIAQVQQVPECWVLHVCTYFLLLRSAIGLGFPNVCNR